MSAVAVATVASVGLGAAAAAGAFAPGAPPQPNVGAMTADQINAMINATPANYTAQAQYNPKFAALNSLIAWQNLFGTPASSTPGSMQAAQTGWYDANGNYLGPTNQFQNRTAQQTGYYDTQGNYLGPVSQFGGPLGGLLNGFANKKFTGAPPGATIFQAGQSLPGSTAPTGAKLYNQGQTIPVMTNVPATPGELATAEAAQPRLLGMQTQSRANDIADVLNLGPAAYTAMRTYNPAVTSLLDSADRQAQTLVDSNGQLDPFTQRALQQNFRSAEAARGIPGGTSDAAMEAYYQAGTQYQRQLQNLQTAGQVAGQTAAYYGDPFQQVLARTSGGVQTPGMAYTANQPSAVEGTAALLNPALTQSQMQGYDASVANQNLAYESGMGGLSVIGSALSPKPAAGLGSGLTSLYNYFASPGQAGASGGL